ncbi:MAG TPA: Ig-like domain-containing protein [Flavobacterium sp.]|nr:Ig-like domain-containing protein [Flavobacterium sp.]
MTKRSFVVICLVLLAFGCAKRGYITGGEIDILPPVVLKTSPKNFSTHFNSKEIVIDFDEYVKLKDVHKRLIVSPPLKYAPEITPYTAAKQIKIRFRDTLLPNTTYSLNFGESIEDNNEGNKLKAYRYVFSTGSYIDSLSVQGFVKDALDKETEPYISVMLYEVNQQYGDSVIYKQNPRYITNTLDSLTSFTLENIKQGKYLLVALKDHNSNNKYDPKQDKVGFHTELINVPTDENYKLEVFKEQPEYKALRAFEATKNRIVIGYEGNPEDVQIRLNNGANTLAHLMTKMPERDSLNIWFKPLVADSIVVSVADKNTQKSFVIKQKEQKSDSLSILLKSSKRLDFTNPIVYNTSTPLIKFDNSRIKLLDKDSLEVAFTTKYELLKQNFEISFDKEENQKYKLLLLPEAMTDFYGVSNDTIKSDFSTTQHADYGNLRVVLKNAKDHPIIIQLTDDKGKVLAEQFIQDTHVVDFQFLNPSLYNLRIIYDTNNNKVWDSGNYLKKIQPEKVIYFPEKIDIRANWDVEQSFILKD